MWRKIALLVAVCGGLALLFPDGSQAGAPVTFVFGAQSDPVCLDPALIEDAVSGRIVDQMFENLVRYEKGSTKIIPRLAHKWEMSADGKTWTFHLQKGVKFHDGTDFNAEAVVKNWDYWWNPKNPLHEAQVKAGRSFPHFNAEFFGFGEDSIVSKVEAVDPATVRFSLKAPLASMLQKLAMFPFPFASPAAMEKAGINSCKSPVGTGPFKFVEWKANESVTMVKFPDYWDKANAAKVDRLVIRSIVDPSQRLAALKAGEIHGMYGVPPDVLPAVRADSKLQVLMKPSFSTSYIAFNFHVKEFQDKRVRQAFAQALNKQSIVDNLYPQTGTVANQLLVPDIAGFNKELKDYPYSLQDAKKLLAEAGFPNGLKEITWENGKKETLVLWYLPITRPHHPRPKEIAEAYAADWAKAGILVKLQTVDWATYVGKRKTGEMMLYMLGWIGDNGDADNWLCSFWCLDKNDSINPREGFWQDKEMSDLLKRAAVTLDEGQRASMYSKVEQFTHDRMYRIYVAHNATAYAFLKNVQGFHTYPTDDEWFNTVSLEK
jgi:peptide/nickel transport system substrate-binding protein